MAGFTNRQTYNGVSYKVFVPENYNSNTELKLDQKFFAKSSLKGV